MQLEGRPHEIKIFYKSQGGRSCDSMEAEVRKQERHCIANVSQDNWNRTVETGSRHQPQAQCRNQLKFPRN
jgi:hypothetical protein